MDPLSATASVIAILQLSAKVLAYRVGPRTRVSSVNADVQPVPVQHHIMATQR
jgi:hypothetical protein